MNARLSSNKIMPILKLFFAANISGVLSDSVTLHIYIYIYKYVNAYMDTACTRGGIVSLYLGPVWGLKRAEKEVEEGPPSAVGR